MAQGAPDILSLAIESGYGSHEAFTRAFREQFGLTPEAVRAQRHLDNIELVEPIKNFEYICGVEVRDFTQVPPEFSRVRIGPQRYAVFTHRDHISTIRSTLTTIWNKWLPESGHEVVDAPNFERYGEEFDGSTGLGGVEVWIPIRS